MRVRVRKLRVARRVRVEEVVVEGPRRGGRGGGKRVVLRGGVGVRAMVQREEMRKRPRGVSLRRVRRGGWAVAMVRSWGWVR